jgi:hypothetical protein
MENPPEQYTQKTFFNDLTALCEQAKAKGLTGPGVIGCLEMAKSVQVQSLVVVTPRAGQSHHAAWRQEIAALMKLKLDQGQCSYWLDPEGTR